MDGVEGQDIISHGPLKLRAAVASSVEQSHNPQAQNLLNPRSVAPNLLKNSLNLASKQVYNEAATICSLMGNEKD